MSDTSIPTLEAALNTSKLRFRDKTGFSQAHGSTLLEALYLLAREVQPTPPGNSQDETIWIQSAQVTDEGTLLQIQYTFDHDYASQYDKTESEAWEVLVTLNPLRVQKVERTR